MTMKQRRLTFDTASRYTLHNVFTKENEHHKERCGDNTYSRHLHGDIRSAVFVGEGRALTVRNQTMVQIVGNKTRPYVAIPCAHHL